MRKFFLSAFTFIPPDLDPPSDVIDIIKFRYLEAPYKTNCQVYEEKYYYQREGCYDHCINDYFNQKFGKLYSSMTIKPGEKMKVAFDKGNKYMYTIEPVILQNCRSK